MGNFRFPELREYLKRSKLSTMMVACFILLNLIFLLIVIWFAYRSFSAVTFREISRARLSLLNESTKSGFDFVPDMTNAAYLVVANNDIKERLEKPLNNKLEVVVTRREITDMLRHLLVINAEISSIQIYTDHFNQVEPSAYDLVYPVNRISSESWFPSLEHADAIWVPRKEADLFNSIISYVQHIYNDAGKSIGLVKVDMSQQNVLQKFMDGPLVLEGEVLIVSTAGEVITQVNGLDRPDRNGTFAVPEEWLRERSFSREDGYELKKQDGETYLVLFSKPSAVQWRLVQIIPASVLLASTNEARWYVMGISVLVLALSAIAVYFFVQNMITPLRRLLQAMKRLEQGDFQAELSSSFSEEYVQMSYGFNQMVRRLRELMDEVRKESRAKREAQTNLLQAQIKPHFLYNTLDMIHWRALDYKADDISFMIRQLSKLFRIGLSGGKMFIRVRDELEHAHCYIELQRVRQPFAIQYKEYIDPKVKGYYIPKIILQPIIENSVIHGRPRQDSGVLVIRLEIRERREPAGERVLIVTLSDNGPGLPAGWRMNNQTGFGIRNVHTRVQLYCGRDYGIQIKNQEGGGVITTIRLPVFENEAQLPPSTDGEVE